MKILLVEDEALIAMDIADTLTDAGHAVAGPVGSIAQARKLIESDEGIEFALLDVNLRGEASYPIADLLKQRGVPFVFTSGYGYGGLDSKYSAHHVLSKPVSKQVLLSALDAKGQTDQPQPRSRPER